MHFIRRLRERERGNKSGRQKGRKKSHRWTCGKEKKYLKTVKEVDGDGRRRNGSLGNTTEKERPTIQRD